MSVLTIEKSGYGRGLPTNAVIIVQSNVIGSCQGSRSAVARHFQGLGRQSVIFDATYKTEAGIVAEDLVDDHIGRRNPADPVEVGETLGYPTREPVPDKTPGKHVEEVPVSTNAPSIGHRRIGRLVIVESIHESRLCQGLGPDHGGRPDQEPADDSSHAEPDALRREDEEHLEAPAEMLLVEDLLSQEDVGCIRHTALNGYRGHHDDDGVLFHVERAWVEVPLESKGVELVVR